MTQATRLYPRIGVLLSILIFLGCRQPNVYQEPPPPEVTVANPLVRDVTIYLEETGQTESVDRAEVRARVQGFLEEIRFEPGAEVTEGDILYVIERRQYQASYESAAANLLAAQASLAGAQADILVAKATLTAALADLKVAELDLKRLDSLLPRGAITQSEWDDGKAARDVALASRDGSVANQTSVEANLKKAEAQVKQAEAELNQARINLDYTEVKAPISGRITKTDVTRGNLVEGGTLLATIIARDPIWANFNISERDLLRLQQVKKKPDRQEITTVKAYLQRAGDRGYPYVGHMDYADPEVDIDTGTLSARAVFSNTTNMPDIIPGLFVNIRVPVGVLKDALLIPEEAVSKDQAGAYVLIVGSENKVERANVVLANKEDGMVVVRQGLTPDDAIVVVGSQRARPGLQVNPQLQALESSSPPPEEESEAAPTEQPETTPAE